MFRKVGRDSGNVESKGDFLAFWNVILPPQIGCDDQRLHSDGHQGQVLPSLRGSGGRCAPGSRHAAGRSSLGVAATELPTSAARKIDACNET